MNDIQRLKDQLIKRFPLCPTHLTQPILETGFWSLDLFRLRDQPPIVVEWRHDLGFGISTPEAGDLGVGVDETYPDLASALARIVALISFDGLTAPHRDIPDKSVSIRS